MAQLYQVVFTGELKSGANAEQAARDFAAVFKVPEEQAWKLVLDRSPHVLKRDIDEANAARYRDILDEIGLEVRVEESGRPAHLADSGDAAAAAPSPDYPAAPSAGAAGGAKRQTAEDAFERNPYAPPQADLTPPKADDGLMNGPHSVPAGHGWQWIKGAWARFRAQPWPWAAGVVLIYGINVLLTLVPVIGGLASVVLGPVFLGGLLLGARAQERTGRFRAASAFDGFSANGGQLALVGVLYFIGIIAVFFVAAMLVMAGGLLSTGAMEALTANDPEALAAVAGPGLVLMLLLIMLLIVPVIMGYWFAPALVALEGMPALQAMITSFRACLMNIMPFLVYGLALLLLMVGLGLVFAILGGVVGALAGPLAFLVALLLLPLMIVLGTLVVVSIYTSYRDIFYDTERASSAWTAQ
jgi:hypothetical protein